MGKQSLTVVIATYNRAENLKSCLVSLVKQTDKDFGILIIDGGSTDKTLEVIETFKRFLQIKLIIDKAPHLAYIRDLGWRHAQGEIVASIDDDVVVSPGWVSAIKCALSNRQVGAVTGPTVVPRRLLVKRDVFLFYTTQNPLLKLIGEVYFRLFMQGKPYAIGKIYPSGAWSPGSNFPAARKLKKQLTVDYFEACNFAVPKTILQELGGYDLGYQDTSEWCEVDLAFRMRKAGYKLLFNPAVWVKHHVSRSGVFSRRLKIFSRLRNFIHFYFHAYYPKTLFGFFQFILYLQFLSLYYIFKYFSGRQRLGFHSR